MDECNRVLRILHQLRESCLNFDGLWIKRRRVFDTEAVVKGLLRLVDGGKQSYQSVMDQMDLGDHVSPAASSFCEARTKLPSFVIGEIRRDILDLWDSSSPQRLWHGYRPHAIDGTKVSLPRPLFDCGFKAPPPSGHCPQGLVSLLVRLDDRMAIDIRLSSQQNERQEALEHLTYLSKGDLVVYNRSYLSYIMLLAHRHQSIEGVFRVPKSGSFLPMKKFWQGRKHEAIVTINPTPDSYRNTREQYPECEPEPIQLRLIKYRIGKEIYVLATTILDESIPRQAFVELYSQRWLAEETFKAYKQTLELEAFHSMSENGIRQEIETVALLWNLTRSLSSLAEPELKKAFSLFTYIASSN